MPTVAGRGPEGRTVAGVVTTNASTTITAPVGTFEEEGAGRTITGTGIPAGATIVSASTDGSSAVISAAATASGTITATLGAGNPSNYGFSGWSPESDAESETYTSAAQGAGGAGAVTPDKITAPNQQRTQRNR